MSTKSKFNKLFKNIPKITFVLTIFISAYMLILSYFKQRYDYPIDTLFLYFTCLSALFTAITTCYTVTFKCNKLQEYIKKLLFLIFIIMTICLMVSSFILCHDIFTHLLTTMHSLCKETLSLIKVAIDLYKSLFFSIIQFIFTEFVNVVSCVLALASAVISYYCVYKN